MTIFNNYKEIIKVTHDEELNIIQAQVRNQRNVEERASLIVTSTLHTHHQKILTILERALITNQS